MKAIVMYASITGNNEEIAEFVQKELNSRGIDTDLEDLFDGDYQKASEKDLIIVSPYTYDKGSIPSEMIDFFEDLPNQNWENKKFIVIGSGDRFYGNDFGAAIDKFDQQLEKTGAQHLTESIKIHTRINQEDKEFIINILNKTL
ncbi:MAG: flavodoxin domain-containing protein [Lactobacillaceae bacterium]|jgi:flavodoxin short chain|nr:flavodoxin domain-containing protein [Lactobacillaceae bacterium]